MIGGPDHGVEEFPRRFALRFNGLPYAAAHVHQHGDGQRQIGVAREIPNLLLAAILADLEILLAQIRDQRAALVRHRAKDVHYIDVHANGRRIVHRLRR